MPDNEIETPKCFIHTVTLKAIIRNALAALVFNEAGRQITAMKPPPTMWTVTDIALDAPKFVDTLVESVEQTLRAIDPKLLIPIILQREQGTILAFIDESIEGVTAHVDIEVKPYSEESEYQARALIDLIRGQVEQVFRLLRAVPK
jgi:hypothetical protein